MERSQASKNEGKSLWAAGKASEKASDGKELGKVQGELPKCPWGVKVVVPGETGGGGSKCDMSDANKHRDGGAGQARARIYLPLYLQDTLALDPPHFSPDAASWGVVNLLLLSTQKQGVVLQEVF